MEEARDNVDWPDPPLGVMLLRLREAVSPDEPLADSCTVPENPLTDVAVIVEVLVEPAKKVTEVGLADRVKSTTLTVTVFECVRDPLVPVIVTV